MAKVDVLGELRSFDSNTGTAVFKIDFLDSKTIEQFENLLQHSKPIKFSFKAVKPFRSRTYQQQKKFWVDMSKILNALKVENTKENSSQLYWFVRSNIFPSKRALVGYDTSDVPVYKPYPPDMKELTLEEMGQVISDLHEYYSYLDIDWDRR